jgi:hypothetical protein
MVRLFVRHQVDDYDAWRKVYDGFDETRRSMGVSDAIVYRSIDDPNDLTVWHDFDSADQARSFAGSEELHEAMGRAGVAGAPEIWFVEEV